MKLINAYTKGLKTTLATLRMPTIIYFFMLLLGVMVVLPFKSVLTKAVGHSITPSLLLQNFNYTIYEDFIRNYGDSLKPFIQNMFWAGIIYFVFSIFFAGGILNIFQNKKNKFSMKSFFAGCGKYFFRFLRLGGIVIVLNIILLLIIYLPLGMIFSHFSETVESEISLFYIGVSGVVLHIVLAILILIISDYTKIKLVTEETTKVLRTFWQSIKFAFRHLFGTYILFLFLLIAPILLFIIYYFIDKSFSMTSGITIFIMFLIQQIFVWIRQVAKTWSYSSQLLFHNSFIEQKTHETLQPSIEKQIDDLEDDMMKGDLIA